VKLVDIHGNELAILLADRVAAEQLDLEGCKCQESQESSRLKIEAPEVEIQPAFLG
jgi:hypothetical protein